ncbi:MAG: hypothetical protein ABIQ30_17590 [Devosia sp.]
MISIVLSVMGLLAVVSWVVAIISAIQIVGLAPKGSKMKIYGQLGWWRFDQIRAIVGPAGEKPIQAYQRSFMVFIILVVVAAVGATLLGAQARN